MNDTKKALLQYVNTASDLAEHVKRCIAKNGTIDRDTIVALNQFIIAANAISDMVEEVRDPNTKLN